MGLIPAITFILVAANCFADTNLRAHYVTIQLQVTLTSPGPYDQSAQQLLVSAETAGCTQTTAASGTSLSTCQDQYSRYTLQQTKNSPTLLVTPI